MKHKQSVLVSGASGLLGRELCINLSNAGHRVLALVRTVPKDPLLNVNYVVLDFAKPWDEKSLPEHVDVVVHLSQSAKFRDFPTAGLDIFRVNVESTARLLDYSVRAKVKQFIYASSGGVYKPDAKPLNESSPLQHLANLGSYAGSKLCGEILCHSYTPLLKSVIIIRPFFIYGGRQNRTMLIPRLMDSVKAGVKINLSGQDGIFVNPIHVTDAAAAIESVLKIEDSATFNIAGPVITSIREICENMGEQLLCKPVFHIQKNDKPANMIADIGMMRVTLHVPKRKLINYLDEIELTIPAELSNQ